MPKLHSWLCVVHCGSWYPVSFQVNAKSLEIRAAFFLLFLLLFLRRAIWKMGLKRLEHITEDES